MSAPRKLAAYAVVLAAVFGASMAAGAAMEPTGLANAAAKPVSFEVVPLMARTIPIPP